MEGLARPAAPSLRPADEPLAPSLPRRVLRHLVVPHGLGLGSRVTVNGDESDRVASLLARLGIDASDASESGADCDAAIRLELGPQAAGPTSLTSPASLDRTAALLAGLRPSGSFLFVARVADRSAGHEVTCLERHLATFPGRTKVAFFADRWPVDLFGTRRSGYAVAAWQAPGGTVDRNFWRSRAAAARPAPCCEWGDVPSRPRRAA